MEVGGGGGGVWSLGIIALIKRRRGGRGVQPLRIARRFATLIERGGGGGARPLRITRKEGEEA